MHTPRSCARPLPHTGSAPPPPSVGAQLAAPGSISLRSVRNNLFCTDEVARINCDQTRVAGAWERFKVEPHPSGIVGQFTLRTDARGVSGVLKWCSDLADRVMCNANSRGQAEAFVFEYVAAGTVAIRGGRSNSYCRVDEVNKVVCDSVTVTAAESFTWAALP